MMDKEFADLIESAGAWRKGSSGTREFSAAFSVAEDGVVRVEAGKQSVTYRLKSLSELYATGRSGGRSLDEQLPLLHTIEAAIKRVYLAHRELTDAGVIRALDQLSLKPETDSQDPLVTAITLDLRLQLSLSEYSREEVRSAIRRVLRSAERHKALAGQRGYLDFICQHVPG